MSDTENNATGAETKNKLFIFDSIAVHFSVKIFLWELLVHLLWPLLNWYAPIAHLHSLSAIGNPVLLVFVVFPGISVIVSVISFCYLPEGHAALLTPLLLHILHKVMVSLKYASMSPTEYKRMILCRDANAVQVYQGQFQLLRGWMQFNRDVYEFEIYGAAARVGVNIDSMHYLIPDHDLTEFRQQMIKTEAEKWDSFLGCVDKHSIPTTGGSFHINGGSKSSKLTSRRVVLTSNLHKDSKSLRRRITIRELLEPCIRYATRIDDSTRNQGLILSIGIAAAVAIIPFFINNPVSSVPRTFFYKVVALLYLVSSTYLTGLFAFVSFQFLFTATIDTQRRYRLASLLSGLVRPVRQDYKPHVSLFDFDGIPLRFLISKMIFGNMHVSKGTGGVQILPATSDIEAHATENSATDAIDPGLVSIIGNSAHQFTIIDCPLERAKADGNFHVPKVDFEIPQNIYAWMYTRLIVQNFGQRVLFRISLYSGGIFLGVIVAGLTIVFSILHSDAPYELARRPVVIQCIVLALASVLVLIKYIFLGSLLNDEFAAHRNLLVLNAMRCESELAELLTIESDHIEQEEELRSAKEASMEATSFATAEEKGEFSKDSVNIDGSLIAITGVTGMEDLEGSTEQLGSNRMNKYQQLVLHRMDSRFTLSNSALQVPAEVSQNSPTNSDRGAVIRNAFGGGAPALIGGFSSIPVPPDEPASAEDRLDDVGYPVHNVHHSMITRLKIFELEESIKAMRRAVEAIDISNAEYTSKVLGIPATTALIVSLVSSVGAFAITLVKAVIADKRVL